jgi:ribosomal protein S12 methylthiotransferase
MDVMSLIGQLRTRKNPEPLYHIPGDAPVVGTDEGDVLRIAQQGASAYVKIADGCRRPCAFCAIPLIKGTLVSRPMEAILREAEYLQTQGVREINLIAQDSTDWGSDLGMRKGLASLLGNLVERVPDIDWIRVLYNYPGSVSDEQIEMMAEHTQLIPYLDMPLQHAHPETLKRMKRPANMDWVYRTIEKMRKAMPDLTLRSTFIVGYPGETEAEFETLMDFIREIQFDRAGAFTFSFEENTSSEPLGDPIAEEIKLERKDRLMRLQQEISLSKNQALVGETLDVLVEGMGDVEGSDEQIAVGRSYRDAPEIDGMVFIDSEAPIGEIVPVRITGALPYDLSGRVETERNVIEINTIDIDRSN